MIDARTRFSRLLEIPSFLAYCEAACEEAARLTRCSIAIWDPASRQKTRRHMFHRICQAFYDNDAIRSERCDKDDLATAHVVVARGLTQTYRCWAGFTCDMVPIKVGETIVGLISIGEFFTPQHHRLTRAAAHEATKTGTMAVQEQIAQVPVLDESKRRAVRRAVEHLAEILADIVLARINPTTLPSYLKRATERMIARSDSGEGADEDSQLSRAIDAYSLVSLANLYFEDLAKSLAAHRGRALHDAISPLTRVYAAAGRIKHSGLRGEIVKAADDINENVRQLLSETDVLGGTWWQLTPKALPPGMLAAELEREYRPKLQAGDELTVESQGHDAPWVDLSLARSFGRILLDNALKATVAGSRKVKAMARAAEGDLFIEVVDNGCGVPIEHGEAIFDARFRAGQPGYSQAGNGHGLYKLKQNLMLIGGEVAHSPTECGGTQFVVRVRGF